jgi:dolichyl-phosphate beta-glucosyltransferase
MTEAGGECALFSDADLSTPIDEADALLEALEDGADIAIGSRILAQSHISVHQPWLRERLGRLFGFVVGTFVVPGIHDTQCGFKCFRREVARDVFSHMTIHRWAFDVEMLTIAQKLGYEIAQVPVRWENDPASKVNVPVEGPQMLLDILRAKWRHRNLKPTPDEPE